jgi:hypothetical protein
MPGNLRLKAGGFKQGVPNSIVPGARKRDAQDCLATILASLGPARVGHRARESSTSKPERAASVIGAEARSG